jgi:hypothetical protein
VSKIDELIDKAIERGEQQAARVLEGRSSALEERVTQAAASTESAEEAIDEDAPTLDADLVRAAGGILSIRARGEHHGQSRASDRRRT